MEKTYLLGAAFLKPSTVVFMMFFLLEPPQKEIMVNMVFIFPMLDKVDVFFMNRGEKLRKTRPRSWKNSHGNLEGGVNQWLGCCWFHVGQIGFFSVPKGIPQ